MRRVRLGRTGVEISAVGVGTWAHGGPVERKGVSVGWSEQSDDDSREALRRAHERGIDHWDTADVYGDGRSEQLIGTVFRDIPRHSVFLATKGGWNKRGFDSYYHRDTMRLNIEQSLRNLQTETIDLYYLHHCNFPSMTTAEDAIEALRRARDAGKIRFIGLSDWDMHKLFAWAKRLDPDVVQAYRNVLDDAWCASGLQDDVAIHDRGVVFFGPLKQGFLLGKHEAPPVFTAGDYRRNIPDFQDIERLAMVRAGREAMKERFRQYPEPLLQGLIGTLWNDASSASVLIGQRNPTQVDSAANVSDVTSAEDAAFVRALFRSLRD